MPGIVINEFEVVAEPRASTTVNDSATVQPPSASSSVSDVRRIVRFVRERERRLRSE